MKDTRQRDKNWIVTNSDGDVLAWDQVHAALLMDLRDELKRLNRLLGCPNFTDVPTILRQIRRNTTKPKRRKPVR